MLVSLWCMAVVLLSIVIVGFPIVWLLGGRKPLTGAAWLHVPFVGTAAIVLILQNLYYLDVPVRRSTPFLWAAALGGWLWIYKKKQLGGNVIRCPGLAFAGAAAVFVIQGLGLFLIGATHYVGRAAGDQYNYTMIAHFIAEQPFTVSPSDIEHHLGDLWVSVGWHRDRIGQSVLHAFFTVTGGTGPKTMFEPTSMLGPALASLAIFLLGRRLRLNVGMALTASLAGGLMPGLALLHLESFFSNTLALPFVLYLPGAMYEFCRRPNVGRAALVALPVAAGAAIYTEFWPIFAGLVVVMAAIALPRHPCTWKLLVWTPILAVSAPFVLNPGFARWALPVLQRSVSVVGNMHGYPWWSTVEGWSRLWLGDMAVGDPHVSQYLARWVGVGVTALAYSGLVLAVWHLLTTGASAWRSLGRRCTLALAIGTLAAAMLPCAVAAYDDKHSYQFYKLLLSFCPLFPLGLALLANLLLLAVVDERNLSVAKRLLARFPVAVGGMLVLGVTGWCTGEMASNSTKAKGKDINRVACQTLRQPYMHELQDQLEKLEGQHLLLAGGSDDLTLAWMAHFARHNRISIHKHSSTWMYDRALVEGLGRHFGVDPQSRLEALGRLVASGEAPAELLCILTDSKNAVVRPAAGDIDWLWSDGMHDLLRTRSGGWAVILSVDAPGSAGIVGGKPLFYVVQAPTTLEVLANAPGTVTLTGDFQRGPALPEQAPGKCVVRTADGQEIELTVQAGEYTITLPLRAGKNTIQLASRDEAKPLPLANGDPRPLMWSVHGMRLEFATSPAANRQVPAPQ